MLLEIEFLSSNPIRHDLLKKITVTPITCLYPQEIAAPVAHFKYGRGNRQQQLAKKNKRQDRPQLALL
jgi:hypothetical protein